MKFQSHYLLSSIYASSTKQKTFLPIIGGILQDNLYLQDYLHFNSIFFSMFMLYKILHFPSPNCVTSFSRCCGCSHKGHQDCVQTRVDHDRVGQEYRYLDWYATANTDYAQTWCKNLVFSLVIKFFPVCGQWFFFNRKSGAWGFRPTCHPQTPPLVVAINFGDTSFH